MRPPSTSTGFETARRWIACVVTAVLVGLVPFSSALAIHHAFAAADHDGHQHSSADLCEWIQHHSVTSVGLAPPSLDVLSPPTDWEQSPQHAVLVLFLDTAASPRGPPLT